MTLSPCRITTLPDSTALPSTSKLKSWSSASMVTRSSTGSRAWRRWLAGYLPRTRVRRQIVSSPSANSSPWTTAGQKAGYRQHQQPCGRSLSRHLRTILIRMLKNDARLSLIRSWLTRDLGWRIGRISVASADASFRRYFRVSRGDVDPAAWAPKADTLIVMDAPPGKEDIAPYLKVTSLLEQAGAHVPHVHASDAQARLHRDGRPGRHPVPLAAQDRSRRRQTLRRRADHARQHPGARPACRRRRSSPTTAHRSSANSISCPSGSSANICGSSSRPKSARC